MGRKSSDRYVWSCARHCSRDLELLCPFISIRIANIFGTSLLVVCSSIIQGLRKDVCFVINVAS